MFCFFDLFDSLKQLIADCLHTLDRRMTVLLLDVNEFDELHIIVLAYFAT